MSSQTGVEKMNVNMFLDRVYEEHGELTPEFIIKLARAVDLDAYRTINMLCNYINICRKVEEGRDLALICLMNTKLWLTSVSSCIHSFLKPGLPVRS